MESSVTSTPRKWSKSEDEKLKSLVEKHGEDNWKKIAENFPERKYQQVRQRWIYTLNPEISKTPWSKQEDELIILKQNEIGNKWNEIAKFFPGRTGKSIRDRWRKVTLKPETIEYSDKSTPKRSSVSTNFTPLFFVLYHNF